MRIMLRYAEDDFAAMRIGNAMESVGASVIAITPNGTDTFSGALQPHIRYIVWARIENDSVCDNVDDAIELEFK